VVSKNKDLRAIERKQRKQKMTAPTAVPGA